MDIMKIIDSFLDWLDEVTCLQCSRSVKLQCDYHKSKEQDKKRAKKQDFNSGNYIFFTVAFIILFFFLMNQYRMYHNMKLEEREFGILNLSACLDSCESIKDNDWVSDKVCPKVCEEEVKSRS